MKTFLLALVLVILSVMCFAQTPDWIGAKRAGGTGNDRGQSIALDSQGNQYVTGVFQGTADFGTTILNSSGNDDMFIAKLSSDGDWLWAKQCGGTGLDGSWDIALDGAGNSYITGRFCGTAEFGQFTLQIIGTIGTFAAKLDTDGNWLWAVQTGAHDGDNEAMSIALDSQDNVYLTGCFWNSVHFGTISFTANGQGDIFVAKLDTNGNWLAAYQYGGNGWDAGMCVCTDYDDHVYAAGYFNQTVVFGTTTLTSHGADDIFILELDSAGSLQWAKQAGGTNVDYAWDISSDSAANVFVAGSFIGTATFGTHQLTSAGGKDAWIAKLDSNGEWLWVYKAGGTGEDVIYGLTIDSSDDVYLTGYFQNTMILGAATLTSQGGIDIFVAKEDNAGTWHWMWAVQAGGVENDYGGVLGFDSAGNAYLIGGFQNTVQFGTSILTSSGNWDTYVALLGSGTGVDDDTTPELTSISCYPNPFSGNLTISLDPKYPNPMTVTVFNLKGQKVKEWVCAGKTDLTWDGRDSSFRPVTGGVYTVKLLAGGKTMARKVVLLR